MEVIVSAKLIQSMRNIWSGDNRIMFVGCNALSMKSSAKAANPVDKEFPKISIECSDVKHSSGY